MACNGARGFNCLAIWKNGKKEFKYLEINEYISLDSLTQNFLPKSLKFPQSHLNLILCTPSLIAHIFFHSFSSFSTFLFFFLCFSFFLSFFLFLFFLSFFHSSLSWFRSTNFPFTTDISLLTMYLQLHTFSNRINPHY